MSLSVSILEEINHFEGGTSQHISLAQFLRKLIYDCLHMGERSQ